MPPSWLRQRENAQSLRLPVTDVAERVTTSPIVLHQKGMWLQWRTTKWRTDNGELEEKSDREPQRICPLAVLPFKFASSKTIANSALAASLLPSQPDFDANTSQQLSCDKISLLWCVPPLFFFLIVADLLFIVIG